MLPKKVTVQLLAFLALSGGVAANIFLLQSRGAHTPVVGASDLTAWNIAAIEAAEFGDTGSIGGPSKHPAEGLDLAAIGGDISTPAISSKDVTRAIQRELQIRGYETGSQDGIAGTMTRGAIMAYEQDHGLPLTAQPSDALLKAIVLGEGGKPIKGPITPKTGNAREVVRSVQLSLKKLGYKPGAANGVLTPQTANAIRAFESDQGFSESGRISGPLIARLGRLAGEGRVAAAPQ